MATHTGGDDWTARIMDWIINEFKKDTGITKQAADAVQRIKEEAEKARSRFRPRRNTKSIALYPPQTRAGRSNIQKKLTRSKMEQLCDDLVPAHCSAGQSVLERRTSDRTRRQ